MDLNKIIVNIKDFPVKGINFKDLTPVLNDNKAYHYIIDNFLNFVKEVQPTVILAPEARGFWFGPTVAYAANLRFIPIRKAGKLPRETIKQDYILEYDTTTLEMSQGDLLPTDKVLIIDDVLATGGTILAINELIKSQQASVVGVAFVATLSYLEGWNKLQSLKVPLFKLIEY